MYLLIFIDTIDLTIFIKSRIFEYRCSLFVKRIFILRINKHLIFVNYNKLELDLLTRFHFKETRSFSNFINSRRSFNVVIIFQIVIIKRPRITVLVITPKATPVDDNKIVQCVE